jgi:protein TonB
VEKKNTPQNKAAAPTNAAPGAPPPMFGNLISSKPKRAGAGGVASTATSIVVHAAIIVGLVYATAHAAAAPVKEDAPVLIQLAPEEPPPPPPPPPKLDVPPPQAAEAPVAKGFQTLAVPDVVPPDIPPPQVGVQIREEDFSARGVAGGKADGKEGGRVTNDLAAAPFVVPMDVAPKLLNREAVGQAIQRNYPPMLRDASIGGTTTLWFFIDETGKVVKTVIKKPSGYDLLDNAAKKVADIMKFTPALSQDKKIPVWVALDVVFQVK